MNVWFKTKDTGIIKKMIKSFFRTHAFVLLLLGIVTFLGVVNYVPGTYLTGWDNLQSDLHPVLGIKRAIFSGWQEFQSFGLPAGMAHSADLIHAISIWIFSLFLPQSFLRYFYQILMVVVGVLGMYKLMESIFKQKALSFIGGLFYIFNFMVIQLMYVPVEPFSVFLGMLPWQIWIFLQVVRKEKVSAKEWVIYLLITLLSTPQAVAQQLFVVLMFLLGVMSIGRIIQEKGNLQVVKRAAFAGLMIILMNSFWIFPQIYFLKTNKAVVENAKINQLSTDDIFYRNKDKGNIADFLSYTGFFYESFDSHQKLLFAPWKDYRENIPMKVLIYGLSSIVILGMFAKSKYRLPFLLSYLVIAFSLLLNTFPFDFLNELIRKNTLINQIFRSPFTKFAIPYALISTYFFVAGVGLLLLGVKKVFHQEKSRRWASGILLVVLSHLLLIQALPALRGEYIAKQMKVKIPQEYFQAFEYFKSVDKNKRIALLPEYTHWGWLYTKWGYDGSGFLWYGIEQPIISRNFDYWDNHSESYYWEIKRALEREDLTSVERVFEKYGIDYILYDRSISPIVASTKALQFDRIDTLIEKSSKIQVVKKWGGLSLYGMRNKQPVKDFVWTSSTNLPNIGPAITITDNDAAYKSYGTYQTDSTTPYSAYFPYLDVTSQTKRDDEKWMITEDRGDFVISRDLSFDPKKYTLNTMIDDSANDLYTSDTAAKFIIPYAADTTKDTVTFRFPKVLVQNYSMKKAQVAPCTAYNSGSVFSEVKASGVSVEAKEGGYGCFHFDDENLEQRNGYLLKITNKNVSGQRLYFYVSDKTKDQTYLEDRFTKDNEYYLVGSKYQQGIGYAFAFQTNSYKTVPSVNTLESFSVYLLPYDIIKQFHLLSPDSTFDPFVSSDAFVSHKDTYYRYYVTLNDKNIKTIVLNQTYQEGWKAYVMGDKDTKIQRALPFLFGKEITDHVSINNWANGWNVSGEKQIVLLYWPQYLQYAGFGIVLITFGIGMIIVLRRRK